MSTPHYTREGGSPTTLTLTRTLTLILTLTLTLTRPAVLLQGGERRPRGVRVPARRQRRAAAGILYISTPDTYKREGALRAQSAMKSRKCGW
jgi:hypothetical protein